MDLGLSGKKALVFGASQGIGRAIAKILTEEGATVTVSARHEVDLVSRISEGEARHAVVSDLTRPGSSTAAVTAAIEVMHGLDILVINTGGPQKGSFLQINPQQWQEDFQNLWLSLVEAVRVALPEMKKNSFGRIIFITSIAGKEPLPNLTTSNGLRAGLEGLAKSIANETAALGITVNVLRPGYTNTDRLKELNLSTERIQQMVPAGRLGEPRELASLAAFLSSVHAGYITGQCISIDGGVQRSF